MSPPNSSAVYDYTGPFTVSQSETINVAIAQYANGNNDQLVNWSAVVSASFTINNSTTATSPTTVTSPTEPTITPDGGNYNDPQTVTIGNIYGTAYYTTDGSNPETSSTRIAYTGPFTVYQSETIQAVAYSYSGWGGIASATFNMLASQTPQQQTPQTPPWQQQTPPEPTITPDGGTFSNQVTMTITTIPGDTTYFTVDGSNPETSSTRVRTNGFSALGMSATVNAAIEDQYGNWSGVASASFAINTPATVTPPTTVTPPPEPPVVTIPNKPTITSVSFFGSGQGLQMTINGFGFGALQAGLPYTGNSSNFRFQDISKGWNAGYSGDDVTLNYESWTGNQILIAGFSGDYGGKDGKWTISPGNSVGVIVQNSNGQETSWTGILP